MRNVFIIFLVSGFWHGANWTFIVWGGIHAALFLPLLLRGKNRRYTSDTIGEGRWLPTGREFLGMAWTFTMVCVAWVFFRAESVGEAVGYILKFTTFTAGSSPHGLADFAQAIFLIFALIAGDIFFIEMTSIRSKILRWALYVFVLLLTLTLRNNEMNEFIYFQF